MKNFLNIHLMVFLLLVTGKLTAQTKIIDYNRNLGQSEKMVFNPELKPFYHGVASGDPLTDRVIIWTRITPDSGVSALKNVKWQVATDSLFKSVVKSGIFTTYSSIDYTVKVDVTGLQPGTTYYYAFSHQGTYSLTGRMRTASNNVNHLRFAVVSCNNYEAGFFNGFKKIGQRNDIDAVIHLGDYIYEYQPKGYGDSLTGRFVEPAKEIVTLDDYRTRYSVYRLDQD
jgi:alkaline phosphatase D